MKKTNIEKRSFRRTKTHRHLGREDKGHIFYNRLLFISFVICSLLLGISVVSAQESIFQGVTIEPIRNTSVVILWEVSETAPIETFTTSQIEYGLDANYGYITEDDDLAYFHHHEITGLSEGTFYHFRIKARDYEDNEYTSGDYNFTTRTQTEMDNLVKAARVDGELSKIYYVRNDGNNTCSGLLNCSYVENSTDCAFRTISHGMSVLDAGDTLRVQAGTYHESAQGLQHSGILTHYINIIADGEVILDGQNNFTDGFWIDSRGDRYQCWGIDGFTIQNYTGTGIYPFSSGSWADDLIITNCTIRNIDGGGILIEGLAENIIIKSNTFDNITAYGIYASPAQFEHSVIAYNTFHNIKGASGVSYGINFGGDYSLVEHNNFTNSDRGITTGGNFRSTIRHNTFSDLSYTIRVGTGGAREILIYRNNIANSGMTTECYPGVTVTFISNYIEDCGRVAGAPGYLRIENTTFKNADIQLGSGSESGPKQRINTLIIRDNIMTGGAHPLLISGMIEGSVTNNIFKNKGLQFNYGTDLLSDNVSISNNVFYNSDSGILVGDSPVTNLSIRNNAFMSISGNCVDNQKGANVIVAYNDIWDSGSPAFNNVADTNTRYEDPLFANVAANDFHLKSQYGRWDSSTWVKDDVTSPCINAGELNGEKINMGAYGNTEEASKGSSIDAYNISGYVNYINGTGIYNASVTINITSADDYTAENGYYALTGLTKSIYNITASKTGFYSNFTIVTIDGADVETADIILYELSQDTPPYKPNNPSPSDGTSDISINTALSWAGGDPDIGDTVTYNVYFGTNTTPPLVSENQPETIYNPGTLNYSTIYYWNIVAKDAHGASNESGVWNFTTAPDSDLIGLWHFDEETGGIVVDSSSNANNGTIYGNAMWTIGKLGAALEFDGTDDYIEILASPSLNSITSQITIEAWIKTDFSQRGTLVDNWYYDKTVEPAIAERAYVCTAQSGADAGKFSFGVSPVSDGTGQVWLTSNTAVTPGQWTHVAFVSDATNMSIYINGNLDAVTSAPSQIHQSNRPIHIGAWNAKEVGNPPFDTFFNGTLDELKIYNRALSEEEIQADYEAGFVELNTLSGTITTPDSAGIPNATVTLATVEGDLINTTQTDSIGNYTFTDISAGTYNLTVKKPRFWPASNITVTTGNTEDIMLWLKGDLNLNGTQADSGDLLMMNYAATGRLIPDWKFDLNGNGDLADAGDLLMLEETAAGKIELW